MKTFYPRTLNCWLKNFPPTIMITCGPNITELEGPWINGSQVILAQTPTSKVHQGIYEINAAVPAYQARYSTTGFDTDAWTMYLKMFGWGTFFAVSGDANYWLRLEKYFEIISSYTTKTISFSIEKNIYTGISKAIEVPGLYIPVPPVYNTVTTPGQDVNPPETAGHPGEFNHGIFADTVVLVHGSEVGISYVVGAPCVTTQTEFNANNYTIEIINAYASFWYYSCNGSWNEYIVQIYKAWDRGGFHVFFVKPILDQGGSVTYQIDYFFNWSAIIYNGVDVTSALRGIV